jgi:hypothetical protein
MRHALRRVSQADADESQEPRPAVRARRRKSFPKRSFSHEAGATREIPRPVSELAVGYEHHRKGDSHAMVGSDRERGLAVSWQECRYLIAVASGRDRQGSAKCGGHGVGPCDSHRSDMSRRRDICISDAIVAFVEKQSLHRRIVEKIIVVLLARYAQRVGQGRARAVRLGREADGFTGCACKVCRSSAQMEGFVGRGPASLECSMLSAFVLRPEAFAQRRRECEVRS